MCQLVREKSQERFDDAEYKNEHNYEDVFGEQDILFNNDDEITLKEKIEINLFYLRNLISFSDYILPLFP